MELQEFINGVERMRSDLLQQATHYLNNPDDAEDAVQETLVKLWMAKERIADSGKLKKLASVVCKNTSLNMLRDAKQFASIDNVTQIESHDNPHKRLEDNENEQKLEQSINALNDKYRAIIRMRNVENLSYSDIAKIIGTSESSIRGMISKARMELIRRMRGDKL